MNNAFVIGHGFVGKATCKSLDIPYWFSLTDSNITLEEGAKLQFCFICLPTSTDEKGTQTEARKVIADYVKQIVQYNRNIVFIIRSTVTPGTCKALSKDFGALVASNPEFLSEDTWEDDAVHPRIIVFGTDNKSVKIMMESVWKDIPCKIRVSTDTVTSETLKYAFNTFFATKIIWANQLYDICQKNGANYKVIHEALHEHPWGSKHHLKVIHKGGRGAGGHCFPKDLKLFAQYGNSELLKTVEKLNNEYLNQSKKT